MLKTFGMAAATLLVVTAADASFAQPATMNAGFGRQTMMAGSRSLPQFGQHPDRGFFHGDHDFHRDHDFHGDHDVDDDPDFDHDFDRDRDFHHHHRHQDVLFWGWPWGWWPDHYEHHAVYPAEHAYPPPPPVVSQPPSPPPCPELIHWDAKTGQATRQKLCD